MKLRSSLDDTTVTIQIDFDTREDALTFDLELQTLIHTDEPFVINLQGKPKGRSK